MQHNLEEHYRKVTDILKDFYGVPSMRQLAKAMELTPGGLTNWKVQGVPQWVVQKVKDIKEGRLKREVGLPYHAPREGGLIPVVGIAEAGCGSENIDLIIDEYVSVPHGFKDSKAYAVRVIGDSMLPLLRQGTLLLVSPNTIPCKNDLVIVKLLNNDVLVKQIHPLSSDNYRLMSYNPEYEELKVHISEIKFIHTVYWFRRPK